MTNDELVVGLDKKQAMVVHLSHYAVMDPSRPNFPEDMQRAIARADITLSCVVVWPGHGMDLPGSVGVIFAPSSASVVSVSNSDAGATTLPDGSDGSAGVDLTAESFEKSFEVVGAYNEWRVKGARVKGIFVADPRNIMAKKVRQFEVGGEMVEMTAADHIELAEVLAAFPHQRVFTMGPNGMVELPRPWVMAAVRRASIWMSLAWKKWGWARTKN
jgi:hypothetical protein